MSVQQVAAQLGKSDALVYKWERGAVPPPENKLIAQLAAILGAETDALFWSAGRLSPDIQFTFNKNPAMYARLIRVADSLGKNGVSQVIERCQTHRRSEAA
jgi:transcriptional regulator with XRE-family HTH domain